MRRVAAIATYARASRPARAWRVARARAAHDEGLVGVAADIVVAAGVTVAVTFFMAVFVICFDLMWITALADLGAQGDWLEGVAGGVFATRLHALRETRDARIRSLDSALRGTPEGWPDDWDMDR